MSRERRISELIVVPLHSPLAVRLHPHRFALTHVDTDGVRTLNVVVFLGPLRYSADNHLAVDYQVQSNLVAVSLCHDKGEGVNTRYRCSENKCGHDLEARPDTRTTQETVQHMTPLNIYEKYTLLNPNII